MGEYYTPSSDEHIAREKDRGRDLRGSQWWKNRLGQGRCHYCGLTVPPRQLTMDHVVPAARTATRQNAIYSPSSGTSTSPAYAPVDYLGVVDNCCPLAASFTWLRTAELTAELI